MTRNSFDRVLILTGLGVLGLVSAPGPSCSSGPGAQETPSLEPPAIVLNAHSNWRCFMVWKTELVRTAQGALAPVEAFLEPKWGDLGWARRKQRVKAEVVCSPPPPADWAQPDFDDRAWVRSRGPLVGGRHDRSLAALCLRGKFEVKNQQDIDGLTISISYRGGAVVYLNGREIARGDLADGKVDLETPAEDYPKEAYVDPDGYLLRHGFGDPEKYRDRFALRTRHLSKVKVAGRLLRRGVNVLAVEVHRAPTSEVLLIGKPRQWTKGYCWWSMLGFHGLELAAPGSAGSSLSAGRAGLLTNAGRPAALHLFNALPSLAIYDQDYGDPNEPLEPIRLIGARNGAFSGVVAVGSPRPIEGLKLRPGDLKETLGAATIPASAILVRFARPDGDQEWGAEQRYPRRPARFDSLVETAPAAAISPTLDDGVTQPVWITVRVPREVPPGEYRGIVTCTAEGLQTTRLPVHLKVHDFVLPDPQDFLTHVGLVQSPDSLALKYNVPMWSERHWALLEQSFKWLGEVGSKVVFVPLLRRTHFGNEHSMVRWIRRDGKGVGNPDVKVRFPTGDQSLRVPDTFSHDFSIVERYLDTAVKHLGKVPVVCLYCWEPYTGSQYFGHEPRTGKGMLFTVLDRTTGQLEEAEGPKWGDSQVRAFWKPVLEGMRNRLADRGLAGAMMVGVAGDSRPTREAVEDLKALAPEARWVLNSHGAAMSLHGQPVGYLADVWSSPSAPDPAKKRLLGWTNPALRTTFPREGSNTVGSIRLPSPPAHYRLAIEGMQAAGIHGMGRIGADFWPVVKDPRGRTVDVLGRYPESGWGQLNLRNSFAYVLGPGPDGPVATVRFEMIREGVQEAEARICIEKALANPALRQKLGEDRAAALQGFLDQRTRDILRAKAGSDCAWLWYASLIQERSDQLYAAAAEVAARSRPSD